MRLPAVHPSRSAASGFTMTELALSIAVVGIALVAIIGVMPSGFNFPEGEEIWCPLYPDFPVRPRNDPRANSPAVLGLIREGVSVAEAQAVMGAVPEATYRAVLAAIVGFDRRAELPAIGVPTLCLAGSHDSTAPPEMMQRMAARIPGARFAQIEGAGHLANVECPEAFNQRVAAFVHETCRP